MKNNKANDPFEVLLEHLKIGRGFDFTGYKRSSLKRRVEKRMQETKTKDFDAYMNYLEKQPEEFTLLFNTILINVTSFFRDSETWSFLREKIIPRLLAEGGPDGQIRIWSAGCSSGEEAYSLAILLAEALDEEAFQQRIKIYATDASEMALSKARHSGYSSKELSGVPQNLREKYFIPSGDRHVFAPAYRRSIIFGRHDLVQDAPISRVDLIMCRNTLMYFNTETQRRVLARFYYALNDKGILLLGKAETQLAHSSLFTPINMKFRVFSKVSKASAQERMLLLEQAGEVSSNNRLSRQIRLRDVAFEALPLAQIVVDLNGTLVLMNEASRKLFGLGQKDLGQALENLGVSPPPSELRSYINQAFSERRRIQVSDVQRHTGDGEVQIYNLEVSPLQDKNQAILGASVIYQNLTEFVELKAKQEQSSQDLETAYEELQSSNEELQTTNEELQSTVEELETTNEELQATNEEMETMNEELQSTNQELLTTNDQLIQRTAELSDSQVYTESILASLRSGLVVLDRELVVRVWNERAEDCFGGLRAEDVCGQSFLSLDIGLEVEKLKRVIRSCLASKTACKTIALAATNRRGKPVKCRITVTPQLGKKNEILGAVLLVEKESQSEKDSV